MFEAFTRSFNRADVLVMTEVYAAGEARIEGASGERLADAIRKHGHHRVTFEPDKQKLPEVLERIVKPGDMVIALGAGDVNQCLKALAERLRARPKN